MLKNEDKNKPCNGFSQEDHQNTMDPFFKAINGAVGVAVIFVVAVLGGRVLAALTVRDRNAQQAATVIFAVAIFFLFRK
jgi:hypothetical protein